MKSFAGRDATLHCVLACAAGLLSQPASAQGVTVYGQLDEGITRVSPGASTSSTMKLLSGVSGGSYWGLRGVEDLGGGMKAMFQIESGLDTSTGEGCWLGRRALRAGETARG